MITIGLGMMAIVIYVLFWDYHKIVIPEFAFKGLFVAGSILVVISVFGIQGLRRHRHVMTRGHRNVALTTVCFIHLRIHV